MNEQLMRSFDSIFEYCLRLFRDKNTDYGPTWLLYRNTSINDEIWRKAKRIRTLEENGGASCIPEGRDVEYVGIINYCVMFLMKLGAGLPGDEELMNNLSLLDTVDENRLLSCYQKQVSVIRELLIQKNTDYGDAWKSMSLASMTDQVIIRVYRIRKILSNGGVCQVSEGIVSQLYDIINYSVFALIKMGTELIPLHNQ